jgi:pimeloyl-ACP methyl ester carboxylesterase
MKSIILFSFLCAISIGACRDKTGNTSFSDENLPAPPEKIELLSADSLPINYTSKGNGDTVLFFIHGWGINQSYWDLQQDTFSNRFTTIAIDLPGFGQSGKKRAQYSIQQYAADIATVIRQLKLKNVVLIGHSMSGDIILETVNQYPDKIIGIIGIDNFKDVSMTLSAAQRKEMDGFFDKLNKNYRSTSAAYAAGNLFHSSTDSSVRKRVIEDIASSDSLAAISSLTELIKYLPEERIQLKKLRLPLNLINSDNSKTDSTGLQQLCGAGYYIQYIHTTGHYPMIEKPGAFNIALYETIRGLKKTD